MSNVLLCIIMLFCLWHQRHLVLTALTPLIGVVTCVVFIIVLVILIVVELALVVVAPAALLLGFESREWHTNVIYKVLRSKRHDA